MPLLRPFDSGRLADDKSWCHQAGLDRLPLDQADDPLHQRFTGLAAILFDRRQCRGDVARQGDVVEADNADIAGHSQTAICQRTHRADGKQVSGGKYRIEVGTAIE